MNIFDSKERRARLKQANTKVTNCQNQFKSRFLVKSGRYFTSISTQDIAYIMAQNKLNYLIDHAGKKYLIDQNLDQIQKQLNPHEFIKINRNYIVSFKSIEKFESYFNNRLLLTLNPQPSEDVLVNRSYLNAFREWIDR